MSVRVDTGAISGGFGRFEVFGVGLGAGLSGLEAF